MRETTAAWVLGVICAALLGAVLFALIDINSDVQWMTTKLHKVDRENGVLATQLEQIERALVGPEPPDRPTGRAFNAGR